MVLTKTTRKVKSYSLKRKAPKKPKRKKKRRVAYNKVNQSNKQIVQVIFNDKKPKKKKSIRRKRGNQLYNTIYQPSFAPQRIWHTPRNSNFWTGDLVKAQTKYDYPDLVNKEPHAKRLTPEPMTPLKLDFEPVKNKEAFDINATRKRRNHKSEEEKEVDEFYREQEILRDRRFNTINEPRELEIYNSGVGGRVKRNNRRRKKKDDK